MAGKRWIVLPGNKLKRHTDREGCHCCGFRCCMRAKKRFARSEGNRRMRARVKDILRNKDIDFDSLLIPNKHYQVHWYWMIK